MNEILFMESWLKYVSSLEVNQFKDIGQFEISACDNPGWWVKVNLEDTKFANCSFLSIMRNITQDKQPTSNDWLACYVENHIFNGAGGINQLHTIIQVFSQWIQQNGGLTCEDP